MKRENAWAGGCVAVKGQVLAGLIFSGMAALLLPVLRHIVRGNGAVVQAEARLLNKEIKRDPEGGYPQEHYYVTFQLADGRWEAFQVTSDLFQRLADEGTEGVLCYQGFVFKGFDPKSA